MFRNADASYQDGKMQVKALEDIEEGQEVLISYGEKEGRDFFMSYGFVPKSSTEDTQLSYKKCLKLERMVEKHQANPNAKPFIDLFSAVCAVEEEDELYM